MRLTSDDENLIVMTNLERFINLKIKEADTHLIALKSKSGEFMNDLNLNYDHLSLGW